MNLVTDAVSSPTRRRWILLALLACLHLALLQGVQSDVGRMLMLGHLGLFMLWQPFVRAEYRLNALQFSAVVMVALAAVAWMNWWLLILWVMVLTGIVGGKVFFFGARWTKVFYLLVLVYLLGVLLVFLMPQVIPRPAVLPDAFSIFARYGLPVVFLAMAAVPLETETEGGAEVVDFVYSAFVFLLIAVLILGSVAFMLIQETGYINSLLYTLLVVSAVLMFLGWVWNPHAGFSGLGVLFSRYLLSMGLSLEQWLHLLADHAQRQDDPERFLAAAIPSMSRLPWVSGGEWQADGKTGSFGTATGARSEFSHHALRIVLYSRHDLSPTVAWHFNLLAQLVGEFYLAKVRGAQLQHLSYLKAVHETGARLTHDVKNLLQSLNMLCFAASEAGTEANPEFQALLRRQLPAISQRLQQTMEKLQRPEAETSLSVEPVATWWKGLQARYGQDGLRFSPAHAEQRRPVPAVLFNSVAENLIQNALNKKQAEPEIGIDVELLEDGSGFRVRDDGAAIPARIASGLFGAPVPSASGLGIGLYQAARHAGSQGYRLRLAENRPGCVCFELSAGEGRDD